MDALVHENLKLKFQIKDLQAKLQSCSPQNKHKELTLENERLNARIALMEKELESLKKTNNSRIALVDKELENAKETYKTQAKNLIQITDESNELKKAAMKAIEVVYNAMMEVGKDTPARNDNVGASLVHAVNALAIQTISSHNSPNTNTNNELLKNLHKLAVRVKVCTGSEALNPNQILAKLETSFRRGRKLLEEKTESLNILGAKNQELQQWARMFLHQQSCVPLTPPSQVKLEEPRSDLQPRKKASTSFLLNSLAT